MIRVNETEFDENAIVAEMQYHTAETHTEAKNKACESLIISELVRQRAATLGMPVDIQKLDDSAIETLLSMEVEIPSATEEDCRSYFEKNPAKFFSSPLIAARHILLPVAPDDAQGRSEALEQGRMIIRELVGDIDKFPDIAKRDSQCPSAKTGGQLGQLSKGQTVPEFERQVFVCDQGLIEAPIETRYGVHIVDIEYKEDGKALPYEAVKERIEAYLNEKVRRKAIAQFLGTLIAEADIEGFDFDKGLNSPLMQ